VSDFDQEFPHRSSGRLAQRSFLPEPATTNSKHRYLNRPAIGERHGAGDAPDELF